MVWGTPRHRAGPEATNTYDNSVNEPPINLTLIIAKMNIAFITTAMNEYKNVPLPG